MKYAIWGMVLLIAFAVGCGGDSSPADDAGVDDTAVEADGGADADADADVEDDAAGPDADADADADAEEEATPDAEPDGETGDAASACVRSAGVSACGEVVVGGSLAPCTTAGLVENGVRSAGAGSCRR